MDEPTKQPDAVRTVRADRITTKDEVREPTEENVCIVEETPLVIDVEHVETYTILCTPTDRLALAVGFLFTEGVIDSFADVDIIKMCDDDANTLRVRLKGDVPRLDDAGRNLLIVSSCGACGTENLQGRIDALPVAGYSLKVKGSQLRAIYGALGGKQSVFHACGGTHAAALFDGEGAIVACAEDAGRHNALDKAIGKRLMHGEGTAGLGVVLTSRLSLEMVSKCARAGIELVAAVSATTSLAVDVAERCNITLCAFVRETRATVFTHPGRIIESPG